MPLPLTTEAPRYRSGVDRLGDQLGGEQNLRRLLASIADAIERGDSVRLELEPDHAKGIVRSHRLLAGRSLW